jgi:hypothetical protein
VTNSLITKKKKKNDNPLSPIYPKDGNGRIEDPNPHDDIYYIHIISKQKAARNFHESIKHFGFWKTLQHKQENNNRN